jgi:hypothetical protein
MVEESLPGVKPKILLRDAVWSFECVTKTEYVRSSANAEAETKGQER